MKTSIYSWVALLAAVTALAVGGADQALASDGLPQLNTQTFASQLFWLLVTFVVLYILMSRVALPRVRDVLEERETKIGSDLEKAEALQAEAEEILAEYEAGIAQSRSKAHGMLADVKAELDKKAHAHDQELGQKLATMTSEADARISAAKAEASANIRDVASGAAAIAVEKLIGSKATDKQLADAVDKALKA